MPVPAHHITAALVSPARGGIRVHIIGEFRAYGAPVRYARCVLDRTAAGTVLIHPLGDAPAPPPRAGARPTGPAHDVLFEASEWMPLPPGSYQIAVVSQTGGLDFLPVTVT